MTGDLSLTSDAESVKLEEGSVVEAGKIILTAFEKVIVGKNSMITGETLNLTSTGTGDGSQAKIKEGSTVSVKNLTMSSDFKSTIGKDSTIVVEEGLSISTLSDSPDSKSTIKKGANISASTVSLSSSGNTKIGNGVSLEAETLSLEGEDCKLPKSGDIDAPISSDSCTNINAEIPVVVIELSETSIFAGNLVTIDTSSSTSESLDINVFEYGFGDGNFSTSTVATSTYLYNDPGDYIISVAAKNSAGFIGVATTSLEVKPLSAPIASFKYGAIDDEGFPFFFFGETTQEGATIIEANYLLASGTGFPVTNFTTNSITEAFLPDGEYQVTMNIRDSFGGTASTTQLVVISQNESDYEPVVKMRALQSGPNTIFVDMTGSFDPLDVFPGFMTLNWGDGTSSIIDEGDPLGQVHAYEEEGDYVIMASIQSFANGQTAETSQLVTVTSEIVPLVSPVANFGTEDLELTGVVRFFNQLSSSANGALTFKWIFEDGSFLTGPNVVKFFPSDTVQSVTLEVTDSLGLIDTQTQNINVGSGPEFAAEMGCENFADPNFFCEILALDSKGEISNILIDHGDGTTQNIAPENTFGTFPEFEHLYKLNGMYTLTATIQTLRGSSTEAQTTLIVLNGNDAPFASFTCNNDGLNLDCESAGSQDPDGQIIEKSWDMGDGTILTGDEITHTYPDSGSYVITLTVKDNLDAIGVFSNEQIIIKPNLPPVANAVCSAIELEVSCDGSGSVDSEGSIVSYEWGIFDDGEPITKLGVNFNHLYKSGGTKQISLKVTDDQGESNTIIETIEIKLFPLPTARVYCVQSDDLEATCNGILSHIKEGRIVDYEWSYDGQIFKGPIFKRSINSEGNMDISLKVTSDKGKVNTFGALPFVRKFAPEELPSIGTISLAGATTTIFNSVAQDISFLIKGVLLKRDVNLPPEAEFEAQEIDIQLNGNVLDKSTYEITESSLILGKRLLNGNNRFLVTGLDDNDNKISREFELYAGTSTKSIILKDEQGGSIDGEVVVKIIGNDDFEISLNSSNGEANLEFPPDIPLVYYAKTSNGKFGVSFIEKGQNTSTVALNSFSSPDLSGNNDFSQGLTGWEVPKGRGELVSASENPPDIEPVSVDKNDLRFFTNEEGEFELRRTIQSSSTGESTSFKFNVTGNDAQDFYIFSVRDSVTGEIKIISSLISDVTQLSGSESVSSDWINITLPNSEIENNTVEMRLITKRHAPDLISSIQSIKESVSIFPSAFATGGANVPTGNAGGMNIFPLFIGSVKLMDIEQQTLQNISLGVFHPYPGLTSDNSSDFGINPILLNIDINVNLFQSARLIISPASGRGDELLFFDSESYMNLPGQPGTVHTVFKIPSGANINDDRVSLKLVVFHADSTKVFDVKNSDSRKSYFDVLDSYSGGRRFGVRDEASGGDDWYKRSHGNDVVFPFLRQGEVSFNDISKLNGGKFPPHSIHKTGIDIDFIIPNITETFDKLEMKKRQTASMVLELTNVVSPWINEVYSTYDDSSDSPFLNELETRCSSNGISAVRLITQKDKHENHFHINFLPDGPDGKPIKRQLSIPVIDPGPTIGHETIFNDLNGNGGRRIGFYDHTKKQMNHAFSVIHPNDTVFIAERPFQFGCESVEDIIEGCGFSLFKELKVGSDNVNGVSAIKLNLPEATREEGVLVSFPVPERSVNKKDYIFRIIRKEGGCADYTLARNSSITTVVPSREEYSPSITGSANINQSNTTVSIGVTLSGSLTQLCESIDCPLPYIVSWEFTGPTQISNISEKGKLSHDISISRLDPGAYTAKVSFTEEFGETISTDMIEFTIKKD
ncbi:MAG: PKD domain-containing protein [Halobacteriovoraceae bacterium]|nr:PKD domain-containing protein [Halobacteriovoraceae bacterium]